MGFVNTNVLTMCMQDTGHIYQVDLRHNSNRSPSKDPQGHIQSELQSYVHGDPQGGRFWTAHFGCEYITQISDLGHLVVHDRRKLDRDVHCMKTGLLCDVTCRTNMCVNVSRVSKSHKICV